ncbi:MAG: M6 family metalloprotease domain-containing protein [Bacteroidales bacterium]|nr:M6 family metalloprotease domain-containing protein [Candidatus Liminaster caballi]
MKKLLSILVSALVTVSAVAAPAKPGVWRNIRLHNGTEVRAELCGDEFAHCWRDADGTLYRALGNDRFEKVSLEKMNEIRSIRFKEFKAKEQSNMLKAGQTPRTFAGADHVYTGVKKCLIILVQFPDCMFEEGHDKALYERIINEPGYTSSEGYVGSVRDYYRDQSYNDFDIDFTVAGIYTLSHNYAYYGANSGDRNDIYAAEMIREAVNKADADVNYADYDWDGDRVAELVFVIYAGRGEADGGKDDTIWPHKSGIDPVQKDGVRISTYACAPELQRGGCNAADPRDTQSVLDGVGTICHEFSHCMGLPDAYDSQYSGFEGMGNWSIMANGCYLGNSFRPCGYTAYEKMCCGWVDPMPLSDTIEVRDMPAIEDEPVAYAMQNPAFPEEFFLLENRQQKSWDKSLYGNGLLITHIDYDETIWAWNMVNSKFDSWWYKNDHERYTIVPADGKHTSSGATQLANDPYPGAGNTTFSPNSYPATVLYHKNIDGTNKLNVTVTNISKRNGLISFDFYEGSTVYVNPEAPEDALFYESFNSCTGQCGLNDNFAGGTGDFNPDNEGWTCPVKSGGWNCAVFNTQTPGAYATTPAFNLGADEGHFIVTFMAAPFDTDNTSLKLSIGSGNGTLGQTSLTMETGKWTNFEVKLKGSGEQKIKMRALKRFLIDEFAIIPDPNPEDDDPSAITTVEAVSGESAAFNLFGQKVDANAKGMVIINGKKMMKR